MVAPIDRWVSSIVIRCGLGMNTAGFLTSCQGSTCLAGTDEGLESLLDTCGANKTNPLELLVAGSAKLCRLVGFTIAKELSLPNDARDFKSCGPSRSSSTKAVGDSNCSSWGIGDGTWTSREVERAKSGRSSNCVSRVRLSTGFNRSSRSASASLGSASPS